MRSYGPEPENVVVSPRHERLEEQSDQQPISLPDGIPRLSSFVFLNTVAQDTAVTLSDGDKTLPPMRSESLQGKISYGLIITTRYTGWEVEAGETGRHDWSIL